MKTRAKIKKAKKRYWCKKCGRYTAVKHGGGRYRCLECKSVFSPKSRKTCFNKEERLALKALMQLFRFYGDDTPRNYTLSVNEYAKYAKMINDEDISKLAEINIVRHLSVKRQLELLCDCIEDAIVITKDDNNRFRVYPHLFKKYNNYFFHNAVVEVHGTERYLCQDKFYDLMAKLDEEKERRLYGEAKSYFRYRHL